jgi:site-specific DNA recombinase
MKAAMYLRKSRAEEITDTIDETLKRHRETLTEFAEKSRIDVIEIYEEVVSGESLFARPQMLRLLADVEKRRYDAVLCMDIDRLGRGAMSDQGIILETLKNTQTKIITPRKVYDLNNEMDETYSEFESFLARQELKTIKRRMQRGIRKTVEEGGYIANAPYGYVKAIRNRRPTLAVNEEEARFVRMIFDLYVNRGMSCRQIADTINAMGAKPHRAEKFGRTSIMKILRSETYTGQIVWNRQTHIRKGLKGNQKHITVKNPKEKWIIAEGLHPAIIDRAVFERAQEILSSRAHPPTKNGRAENPLAGLVYCARCGERMQRQATRGGGASLVCLNRGCMVSSSLSLVENAVEEAIRPILEQIHITWEPTAAPESDRAAAEAVQTQRRKTEQQLERLCDLLEQGIYDTETFLSRQFLLKERLKKLESLQDSFYNTFHINYDFSINTASDFYTFYRSLDVTGKNEVLKSIIKRIVYRKEKDAKPAEFCLEIYLKPL